MICETTQDMLNLTNTTSFCVTQTTYVGSLTYVFGGLALLSLMILFFRILEGLGKKNQEY